MKKLIGLSLVMLIISVAATAQGHYRKQRHRALIQRQISVGERAELRQDVFRYRMMQRRSQRDGIVTVPERRRLQRAKAETRRDAFRYRHNPRRRLI